MRNGIKKIVTKQINLISGLYLEAYKLKTLKNYVNQVVWSSKIKKLVQFETKLKNIQMVGSLFKVKTIVSTKTITVLITIDFKFISSRLNEKV